MEDMTLTQVASMLGKKYVVHDDYLYPNSPWVLVPYNYGYDSADGCWKVSCKDANGYRFLFKATSLIPYVEDVCPW